eukprot:TRINITY_DN14857_c0_g1_i1.p1 TRINITY_DN14857_c0_g1~~TRINITY_DN14857_c0_g1_i1.p1  ORF type:complete len:197 (+),score=39.35 TRINITY_DN14857_c0_g1_i1:56-592(+)
MNQFVSIVCFSYFGFFDSALLGTRLAQYVERGGGVIIMVYANCGSGNSLKGLWETNAYDPILPKDTSRPFLKGLGEVKYPNHPIMEGVKTFSGGDQNSQSQGKMNEHAQLIACWTNGAPLVVEMNLPNIGKIIGLNFYPPTDRVAKGERPPTGDGSKLIANALFYASAMARPFEFPTE